MLIGLKDKLIDLSKEYNIQVINNLMKVRYIIKKLCRMFIKIKRLQEINQLMLLNQNLRFWMLFEIDEVIKYDNKLI